MARAPRYVERGALTVLRLRVHPTQEWHDLYQPDSVNDLCHFLDRYTKGVENGWEETPALRVSILGFNKVCLIPHNSPKYRPDAWLSAPLGPHC